MARKKKTKREPSMTPKEMHGQALCLYGEGHLEEALAKLRAALKEEETSERWNDWAAVQHALGSADHAETGFRKAFELDKSNLHAAANLGGLLLARGRPVEAAPFLLVALNTTDEAQRAAVQNLISQISNLSATADSAAASAKR